ncbi:hypothetical protein SDC9_203637 [bioreactor metagenome]|uniref:Uncharacterized protein n=1 Tax=bioreactor metagenome TaxID=1076179 RepID=A0A645J8W9_9ZZZZ
MRIGKVQHRIEIGVPKAHCRKQRNGSQNRHRHGQSDSVQGGNMVGAVYHRGFPDGIRQALIIVFQQDQVKNVQQMRQDHGPEFVQKPQGTHQQKRRDEPAGKEHCENKKEHKLLSSAELRQRQRIGRGRFHRQ